MTNILFLDQFNEVGGAQACLLDLLPELARRGWQAHVAIPKGGSFAARLREGGASVHSVACGPYTSGGKTFLDIFRFAFDFPRAVRAIAHVVTANRIDLLYVNGPRLLPAAAWAACGRVPVVFHAHSYLARPYAARMVRWALRSVDATLIASCRFVSEPLRKRAHIIYNGVKDVPFVSRPFPKSGVWRIGVIGRIAPEKGQAEFLRAGRMVVREFPGSRLVICGAPLFSGKQYAESVYKLGEGLPVDFIGWQDDAGAILETLDLLVGPSAGSEATTRVILEAYAAGVPVLAFPAGGIREVIDEGRTGFLTTGAEPDALAARLIEVMRAPDKLPAIALEARRVWSERFTLERYRRQVLDVLESAVLPSNARKSSADNNAISAAIPRGSG